MNLLKSTDPAPSKLSYRVNRLFYKLWFKLLLMSFLLVLSGFLAKKVLYKNIDLIAEIRFLSEEGTALYKNLTELSINRIVVKGAQASLKKEIISLIEIMLRCLGRLLLGPLAAALLVIFLRQFIFYNGDKQFKCCICCKF